MTADIQAADMMTITAPQDVGPGDYIDTIGCVGIAQHAALEGDDVVIVTDGIYSVDVECAEDVEAGDIVYLNATGGHLSTKPPAGSAGRAGVAWSNGKCVNGAASVHLWLNG